MSNWTAKENAELELLKHKVIEMEGAKRAYEVSISADLLHISKRIAEDCRDYDDVFCFMKKNAQELFDILNHYLSDVEKVS